MYSFYCIVSPSYVITERPKLLMFWKCLTLIRATFDIAMTSRVRSFKGTLIDEMKTNRKQKLSKTSTDAAQQINVEKTVLFLAQTIRYEYERNNAIHSMVMVDSTCEMVNRAESMMQCFVAKRIE